MNIEVPLEFETKRSKDGSLHVTDEFYNTLISGFGALLSFFGVVILIYYAHVSNKPVHLFSFLVYGFGLLNVFVASTLHHGVDGSERTNYLLRQWDYFAISLMIAGSFTPFCLIVLRNSLGWTVLGLVWILAIAGIALKALYPEAPKWITTSLFLGMGWLGVVIAKPVYFLLSWKAVLVLVVGGVIYTTGAVVYFFERPNPVPGRFGFHEIWHLFVLGGAASHYCLMFFFLLPFSGPGVLH